MNLGYPTGRGGGQRNRYVGGMYIRRSGEGDVMCISREGLWEYVQTVLIISVLYGGYLVYLVGVHELGKLVTRGKK
jgi:hypothetical protein